jgi:D-alanyl-D-alanine carboxypeptidase
MDIILQQEGIKVESIVLKDICGNSYGERKTIRNLSQYCRDNNLNNGHIH